MCLFQSVLDLLEQKWTKKTVYIFTISGKQEQQAATTAVHIWYAQILHMPKKEGDTLT